MSCQRFRKAIAGHAAGADLQPPASAHLAACEPCRALLQTQRRMLAELDGELQRSLSATASPGFVGSVTRAVRGAHTRPARVWVPAAMWVGLAAAAALVLLVLATSARSPSSPQRAAMDPPATEPGRPASSHRSGGASQGEPGAASGLPRPHHAVAPAAVARPARARSVRTRSVPARAPELPIVVDPTVALAIGRLRGVLAEGRLKEDVLPQPRTAAALVELSIPPLEVPDLKWPGEIAGPPAAPRERQ
jgi:hypothetical protein